MGDPPSNKHSLDRIDVNKNYTPENCKWSTYIEQANNRTNNNYIEFNGEIKTLKMWSEKYNINYKCLAKRLKRGWDIEKALTIPSGVKK
jgi:hypothetical protein